MDLAHQKLPESIAAAGLVVLIVFTSFNPRDHPGGKSWGLPLHFADIETEAGER